MRLQDRIRDEQRRGSSNRHQLNMFLRHQCLESNDAQPCLFSGHLISTFNRRGKGSVGSESEKHWEHVGGAYRVERLALLVRFTRRLTVAAMNIVSHARVLTCECWRVYLYISRSRKNDEVWIVAKDLSLPSRNIVFPSLGRNQSHI